MTEKEQFLHQDGRPGAHDQRDSFFTSRYEDALAWARKFAFFQYPFVTACCGMEYMLKGIEMGRLVNRDAAAYTTACPAEFHRPPGIFAPGRPNEQERLLN